MTELFKTGIIPTKDKDMRIWFSIFATQLPNYYLTLGVPVATKDMVLEYFKAYQYAKNADDYIEKYRKGTISWTKLLFTDTKIPTTNMGQFPPFVALSAPPLEVKAGMIKFLEAVIEICITSPNLTATIAETMGLVPINPIIDWNKIPLILEAVTGVGGIQAISFKKKGATGVEFSIDRNDGKGWVYLAETTTTPFIDKTPYDPKTNGAYKYRGIRFVGAGKNKENVGQNSNEILLPINKG